MDIEKLTQKQQMEEFMFLGLSIMSGVSKKDFYNRFNVEIGRIYGDVIARLDENKLLTVNKDRIFLTDYGIDVSNIVFTEFLLG
jgi:oxygen-independent coproporphyrinogen-3 oxidase